MFFYFSRLLSLTCAFLYPAYASYKTLSKRPASEIDLERWLMYWSVLGVILAAEYVAEWLVRWIPFYWLIKMVFLLYLALPQTEGSTYIYKIYLNPFLNDHESEIDSTIAKLKARVLTYLTEKLRAAWDAAYAALLSQASSSAQGSGAQNLAAAPAAPGVTHDAQQPTLMDPMSGATKMLGGLWQTYGPTVVLRGTALLAAASAAAQNGASRAQAQINSPVGGEHPAPSPSSSSFSDEDRRRQSGIELTPVSATAPSNNVYPSLSAESLVQRSRTSSERSLPAGGVPVSASMYLPADAPEDTNGRYEQIEHEDVDADEHDALLSPGTRVGGLSPTSETGGGWFSGWGRPADKSKTE